MEIFIVLAIAALSTFFCGGASAASASETLQRTQSTGSGTAQLVLTETLRSTGVLSQSKCLVKRHGADVLQSCHSMSKQLSPAEYKAAVASFDFSASAANSVTESPSSEEFSPASQLGNINSGASQANHIRVRFDKSSASRSLSD